MQVGVLRGVASRGSRRHIQARGSGKDRRERHEEMMAKETGEYAKYTDSRRGGDGVYLRRHRVEWLLASYTK